jgi:hypothetical protein
MPPLEKVGDRRAANWNLSSKNSRKIMSSLEIVALTNMGLGDKAAALALSERAMTVVPIEKDAVDGPSPIEILARVSAQMGEPDRAIAALQKVLSIPYTGPTGFKRAAYSCAAPARSNVRSAPERSALPEIDTRIYPKPL